MTDMTDSSVFLIAMGVSGCGKSSLGRRLADALGWPFLEGDDLHPPANVAKMHAGHPLDDADRAPWLAAIGQWMDRLIADNRSGVISCSALKRIYRDALRGHDRNVRFILLQVGRDELQRRLDARSGHFMPASLLDSQLATLEPFAPDEPALSINANGTIEATLQEALAAIHHPLPPR